MERTKTDLRAVSLARLIIGGFFMFEGVMRLSASSSQVATEEVWGFVLSTPLVIGLSLIEVVLGFMLATRNHTAIASMLMALHVAVIAVMTLLLTGEGSETALRALLYKDVAIIGGLLFIHGHSKT